MVDITDLCVECKNYFAPARKKASGAYIHSGAYEIREGSISPLDFLIKGQYFRIVGSVLNDGVYCNTPEGLAELTDETFDGEIWEMVVPKDFIKLAQEEAETKADVLEIASRQGAYISESFNNYSRSIGNDLPPALRERIASINQRLTKYRRISV